MHGKRRIGTHELDHEIHSSRPAMHHPSSYECMVVRVHDVQCLVEQKHGLVRQHWAKHLPHLALAPAAAAARGAQEARGGAVACAGRARRAEERAAARIEDGGLLRPAVSGSLRMVTDSTELCIGEGEEEEGPLRGVGAEARARSGRAWARSASRRRARGSRRRSRRCGTTDCVSCARELRSTKGRGCRTVGGMSERIRAEAGCAVAESFWIWDWSSLPSSPTERKAAARALSSFCCTRLRY